MAKIDDSLDKLRLELRRGVVVLAVLSQMDQPQYGYSLVQRLAEQGLDVEEGTLYPLLRRLEKQGLLESEWEVGETRPRKYYKISKQGQKVFDTLTGDWYETVDVMGKLLRNGGTG